jgi:putative sigma-54 modulation protein
MQLNLTGHHVEITDSLRDYVGSKLTRLERHFDRLTDVHCILTVEKLRHKAEAKVNVSGSILFADSVEDNMYAAIDTLVDKLDRQIKKHKEKVRAHHDKHDKTGDKRAR